MQIFISWSGAVSQQCAEALREWLPFMNQTIAPFVSSQDVSKGERGLNAIATQLQECSFGIVCVTRENQSAPWINFESGAISRELGESSLVPFLLDMPIKDLAGPLTQFQATDSSSQDDVWKMVKSINDKCETKVEHDRLRTTFERFWNDLAGKLDKIRDQHPKSQLPERGTPDILNELVGLVREQNARIGAMEKRIASSENQAHYTINEPREIHITPESRNILIAPESREYRVVPETLEQVRQRQMRTIRALEEAIGVENLIQRTRRDRHGIELTCTSNSVDRVRAAHSALQDLAIANRTAITIKSEDGSEIFSSPPF